MAREIAEIPARHARVERANRTHAEEFYRITDGQPDLVPLAPALRDWEDTYDRVFPHQSLGQLTPAEYLASLGIDV
jgi:transposase InsO family protein